jgi:hypothetical protein
LALSVLALVVTLVMSIGSVNGQVSSYTFAQASGTYTALSSSTIIHASGWDDAVTSITIPFTFTFNGVAYTSCNVSSNGFITFGTTAPATNFYTPISGATGYAGAISALGRDLGSNSSTVVYGTEGAAPNRTFIIQWNNTRRYNGTTIRNGNFNFQIRLNETTNVIQIVYGTCATTYTTDLTVQVGLRGASNADFNNRATTNNWPGSTAGGANTATCNTGTGAGELPTNGLTYTWTPPVIPLNFAITSINYGTSPWCTGDTRSVTATIQNTGSTTWYASGTTNCTGNRQVAVSYKWNGDAGWDTYSNNRNPLPSNVAPGASVSVTFNIQSPNGNPLGSNNFSINLIQQECAWFTSTYTSPAITIVTVPTIATTPSPANSATGVCYSGTGAITSVSWAAVSSATSYDVYFGAGSLPGTVTANVAINSYNCGTLAANTTYYWKVVAKNSCGSATGSSTWTFTTGTTPCYCTPTYTSGCSNGIDIITNVVLENLTNNSGTTCPGTNYIYYSSLTVPALSQGSIYTVAVTVGNDPDNWVAVWLDFNNDGDFADAGEYFNGGNPGSNGTANISITVPVGATLGTTRMRLRGGEDSNISLQSYACGASPSGFGECEDYIVNIVGPAPATPGNPTSNSPSCSGVTITANGSAPAGEIWYWQTSASGTDMSSSGATYVVTSSGTYYIRSRRISDGVWGAAANIAVVVNSAPTSVNAGSDVTICNGSSVQLSGSASEPIIFGSNTFNFTSSGYDGGFAYYLGDYVEGVTSGLPVNAVITSITYTTSVLYYGTDHCGSYYGSEFYVNGSYISDACNVSNQSYAGLNGQPANNQTFRLWLYDIDDADDYIDLGLTLTINYSVTPQLSYSWLPTTGLNNPNISNPIATPTATTTYTMTATANGCSVSDDVTVTLGTIPAVPTVSNDGPVCYGNTIDLTSNGLAPGVNTAYYDASTNTNSVSYDATIDNFTMEMWVKPTGTIVLTTQATSGISANLTPGSYDQKFVVFPGHGGASNGGVGISVGTNGLAVYEHGDGYFASLLVWSGTISNWTHISVVYINKTPNLYINGNYVKTGLTSLRSQVFPTAGFGAGYGNYVGYVDNYRIWNTVRTETQIRQNMYLELPVPTTGMIAHYQLNNNTSASVGNSLTNNGGTFSAPDFYTYTWTGTSAPAASINETQTTGSLASSGNYSVIASGGGCPGTTSTNTSVTVRPEFTPGSINAAGETICQGDDPANIASSVASSGGDNAITYKWQANGSDIALSNSANYNPPAGLLENTTYTRWAKDNTCNTSWTQSSGSWIVTVTQAPYPAGIAAGDYFWTGADNTSWDDTDNWLYYDGSDYSVATVLPTSASDVFIQSYSGTCAITNAITSAASTVYCEDLNIETGLTLGGLSTIEVTGNWTNSGTFVAGTGTVAFNGASTQTVNAGGSSFNNVTFNNTANTNADIAIANPMVIEGNATFTNGIVVYSGTGSLTFGDNASSNGGSSNSFVYGSVIKTGSIPFLFPIGDIRMRDIGAGNTLYKILATAGIEPSASTTVTANYRFTNSGEPDWWEHGGNMDATIHHVSDREYWSINSSVDLTSVTLYWSNNTHANGAVCTHSFCDGDNVFTPADVVVAYWNGNKWIDAQFNSGGSSAAHDQGYIQSRFTVPFGAKGNSFITFGSKSGETPLPVDLVDFNANCDNGKVEINWTTASEINNDYFIIEKSNDMSKFVEVNRTIGAGNSNSIKNYQVMDRNDSGTTYYRLTQVDFDGKTTIYAPIVVKCQEFNLITPSLVVYPNPFNNEINIIFENIANEEVTVEIFDQTGRIILTKKINTTQTSTYTTIDLSELKPAVYNLRTKSDTYLFNNKIIKK